MLHDFVMRDFCFNSGTAFLRKRCSPFDFANKLKLLAVRWVVVYAGVAVSLLDHCAIP